MILGEKLFDLDEVAKMIGVGRVTLTKYIKERGIQPTMIERKKYLNETEIKKLVSPGTK